MTAKKATPDQYPALRDFLRGYFHEDLEDEYGSPEAAARQFAQDTDHAQRQAVAHEWSLLLGESRLSLDQANVLLQKLGSSWNFDSLEEIKSIGEILSSAK